MNFYYAILIDMKTRLREMDCMLLNVNEIYLIILKLTGHF